MTVDSTIYRDPSALVGTQYIEYGPGPYRGHHWLPGFRFLTEDAFVYAEGLLQAVVPAYDHFGVTAVPAAIGRDVASRWRAVAVALPQLAPADAYAALALAHASLQRDFADVARDQVAVAQLLGALADDWDVLLADHPELTVLGL